jgi:hypothetical protein
MLVYGGWTFVALALLSLKYGSRQSQLERQYQGRMLAAEKDSAAANSEKEKVDGLAPAGDKPEGPPADAATFSTPENTVIALWPLAIIFFVIASTGGIMLWRERRQNGEDAERGPTSATRNAPT